MAKNETARLTITSGAYATNSDSAWRLNGAGLAAARSGSTFYFAKMGFNTNGLDIGKSTSDGQPNVKPVWYKCDLNDH